MTKELRIHLLTRKVINTQLYAGVWDTLTFPATRRLRKEELEFKASLGPVMRLCLRATTVTL